MTIEELIMTNMNITEIEVNLRDEKSRLLKTYRIGSFAREYPGDRSRTAPLEIISDKPLNYYEIKSDGGWGTIIKNVPKDVKDLTVDIWMSTTGEKVNNQRTVKLYIQAHEELPLFQEANLWQ